MTAPPGGFSGFVRHFFGILPESKRQDALRITDGQFVARLRKMLNHEARGYFYHLERLQQK